MLRDQSNLSGHTHLLSHNIYLLYRAPAATEALDTLTCWPFPAADMLMLGNGTLPPDAD